MKRAGSSRIRNVRYSRICRPDPDPKLFIPDPTGSGSTTLRNLKDVSILVVYALDRILMFIAMCRILLRILHIAYRTFKVCNVNVPDPEFES